MPADVPSIDLEARQAIVLRLAEVVRGLSFREADQPRDRISGESLVKVICGLIQDNDCPADQIADLSLRVIRRVLAFLSSEGLLQTEHFRRDGSPRVLRSIEWARLIEWIDRQPCEAHVKARKSREIAVVFEQTSESHPPEEESHTKTQRHEEHDSISSPSLLRVTVDNNASATQDAKGGAGMAQLCPDGVVWNAVESQVGKEHRKGSRASQVSLVPSCLRVSHPDLAQSLAALGVSIDCLDRTKLHPTKIRKLIDHFTASGLIGDDGETVYAWSPGLLYKRIAEKRLEYLAATNWPDSKDKVWLRLRSQASRERRLQAEARERDAAVNAPTSSERIRQLELRFADIMRDPRQVVERLMQAPDPNPYLTGFIRKTRTIPSKLRLSVLEELAKTPASR